MVGLAYYDGMAVQYSHLVVSQRDSHQVREVYAYFHASLRSAILSSCLYLGLQWPQVVGVMHTLCTSGFKTVSLSPVIG